MRSHARAERGPGRPMPPPPAPRGTVAAGPRRRRSPETPVPGQSRPGIPRESRAASAPACGTRGVRGIGVWSAPRERLEPRSRAGRQRTRPSPSAVDSTPLEGREGREHRVRPRGPAPRTRAPAVRFGPDAGSSHCSVSSFTAVDGKGSILPKNNAHTYQGEVFAAKKKKKKKEPKKTIAS